MIYAGIDLGGTTIKGALVDENGNILYQKVIPTEGQRDNYYVVSDMAKLVVMMAEEFGIALSDIHSVGVGAPGAIDPVGGRILFAGNFANFRNVEVRKIMQETLPGMPIYLDNDANVAALGEAMFGAGKGSGDVVLITLGTGLGGGIIINGKIFSGHWYGGAELGHMTIEADGRQCTCGRKGCWEAYSSMTALIAMAKEMAAERPESALAKLPEHFNGRDVFNAAYAGDEAAIELANRYYHYLAVGIVDVLNVFQPEYLIIGGGPSEQGDKLLDPVLREIHETIFGGELKTKIEIAELANKAGVIGAAMLGVTNNIGE